jgi:predicted nucleic acid-binding protein
MPSRVCVDINIALKLVLPEVDSAKAQTQWAHWVETGTEIVAPPLFLIEGTSVLCTQVHRGLITQDESQLLLRALQAQQVELLYPEHLHERALTLALRFRQPQAYDAHYLALAETLECEFWTADARLYQRISDALPWVRWLGTYEPPPAPGRHPPP